MMITSDGEKEINTHIKCKIKIICTSYYDDKILDVQEKKEITLYPEDTLTLTYNGLVVIQNG